MARRAQSAFPA
jgi:hypothetical protein